MKFVKPFISAFFSAMLTAHPVQAQSNPAPYQGEVLQSEIVQTETGRRCVDPAATLDPIGPMAQQRCVKCTAGFTLTIARGKIECLRCAPGYVLRGAACTK